MKRFPVLKSLSFLWLMMLGLLTTGCDSSQFYYQAAKGQWQILNARQPIKDLLEDNETPGETKQRLKWVLEARAFAETSLQLPIGEAYTSFVALDHPYVVWNVFATQAYSMEGKSWCYPIAGCVTYRGYFDEAAAVAYANQLASAGMDTYVGGVTAYSTLGWFEDPVLSTFLYGDEIRLKALLFHELGHRKLYVQDDSVFNESFATAVELIGVQQWLANRQSSHQFETFIARLKRKDEFVELVLKHRELRADLYGSTLPIPEKEAKKQALISQLREEYLQLKVRWGGYNGYDEWFEGSLNNAQLSTVATYNSLLSGFLALYQGQGQDIAAFYSACQALVDLSKKDRHATLQELGASFKMNSLYSSISG